MLSFKKCIKSIIFVLFLSFGYWQAQAQTKPAYLNSDSVRHLPAPAFVLKDLEGKTVSLESFKGKVVVIDFWATWCAPCHQSLPFVEKVMNQYKSDSNVQFLFIDTREQPENLVYLVKAFMTKHHYSFKVLLDEISATGKHDKWYQMYHTVGLPTRFIIDGKGIIRFESLGYPEGHSNDQLAAILSSMIEEAKKSE